MVTYGSLEVSRSESHFLFTSISIALQELAARKAMSEERQTDSSSNDSRENLLYANGVESGDSGPDTADGTETDVSSTL